MDKSQYDLMQIVQKIEVFRDLESGQVQRVLRVCELTSFEVGQRVYTAGELSRDMFILLAGKLAVTGTGGEAFGEILPGSSTGEMGLFAGCPRSATVTATGASTGLVIPKDDLFALIEQDAKMQIRILQNLLNTICRRLMSANVCIEDHATQVQEIRERLQTSSEPALDEDGTAEG